MRHYKEVVVFPGKRFLSGFLVGFIAFGSGALGRKLFSTGAAQPLPIAKESHQHEHSPAPSIVTQMDIQAAIELQYTAEEMISMDQGNRLLAFIASLPTIDSKRLETLAEFLESRESIGADEILESLVSIRWGEVDHEAAFEFENKHRRGNEPDIYEGWAAVDFDGAARAATARYTLDGIHSCLGQIDPAAALKLAHKHLHPKDALIAELEQKQRSQHPKEKNPIESPVVRARRLETDTRNRAWKDSVMSMVQEWAASDPNAATAWLEKNTFGRLRERCMLQVQAITVTDSLDLESDPAKALESLSQVLKKLPDWEPNSPVGLAQQIVSDWLAHDRVAAIQWAHEKADHRIIDLIPPLDDLDAAFRECGSLPIGSLRTNLETRLTSRWIKENPRVAIDWLHHNDLVTLPASPGSEEILTNDPFAESKPDDPVWSAIHRERELANIHNDRMNEVFSSALDLDLDVAMDLAARTTHPEWITEVARARTLHEPSETVAWLTGLQSSDWPAVEEAWGVTLDAWVREDPVQASTWIEGLPGSVLRNRGIQSIIASLTAPGVDRDLDAAIDWALDATAQESPPESNPFADGADAETMRREMIQQALNAWSYGSNSDTDAREALDLLERASIYLDNDSLARFRETFSPQAGGDE